MALHAETVVVVVRTELDPDDHGLPVWEETKRTLEGCNVQPAGGDSGDDLGEHVPVTGLWRVSTAEPADWIATEDAVDWRGDRYEVWRQPSTYYAIRPHTEFLMTRTRG